jgi:hypothetical protein
LNEAKVSDLESVSLDAEQLDNEAIREIEQLEEDYGFHESNFKKIVVKNIPRQVYSFKNNNIKQTFISYNCYFHANGICFVVNKALLKPSHAANRLQDQKFRLGDRVVHVQDSGSAPIGAKGIVVGIDQNNIDVVFDVSFISGITLGGR